MTLAPGPATRSTRGTRLISPASSRSRGFVIESISKIASRSAASATRSKRWAGRKPTRDDPPARPPIDEGKTWGHAQPPRCASRYSLTRVEVGHLTGHHPLERGPAAEGRGRVRLPYPAICRPLVRQENLKRLVDPEDVRDAFQGVLRENRARVLLPLVEGGLGREPEERHLLVDGQVPEVRDSEEGPERGTGQPLSIGPPRPESVAFGDASLSPHLLSLAYFFQIWSFRCNPESGPRCATSASTGGRAAVSRGRRGCSPGCRRRRRR